MRRFRRCLYVRLLKIAAYVDNDCIYLMGEFEGLCVGTVGKIRHLSEVACMEGARFCYDRTHFFYSMFSTRFICVCDKITRQSCIWLHN